LTGRAGTTANKERKKERNNYYKKMENDENYE
jgi:hypothetical protein